MVTAGDVDGGGGGGGGGGVVIGEITTEAVFALDLVTGVDAVEDGGA